MPKILGWQIPSKLAKVQWGETEYGIGILPLGGYVKMLGQDDNPGNIAEQVRESQVAGNSADAKEITGPDGKTYLVDRRSYLAKSVPQRMAIISAGVIMNVIFAFIFATIAYKVGVPYNPSIASGTAPGSPAWRADIRPGDNIRRVGDIVDPSYDDLRGNVMLGDMENGVPFEIERDGKTIRKTLKPEQSENKGLARVGIMPPSSLRLLDAEPAAKGSPALKAQPALKGGDEVVAVNGQPVKNYAEYLDLVPALVDEPMTLSVRREKEPARSSDGDKPTYEELDVEIGPRPLRTLGLVMQRGKVTAVQEDSPADAAGIKPGDFIESIGPAADAPSDENAEAAIADDPLALPKKLRAMAESSGEVRLVLRPAASKDAGRQSRPEVVVPLRRVDRLEEPIAKNDPVAVPSLGLAYSVLSVVQQVEPDSPADKAGLKKGDVVTRAELVLPYDHDFEASDLTIDFSTDEKLGQASWPVFMTWLQSHADGTKVKLTYKRGKQEHTTKELLPTTVAEEFAADRGLNFGLERRIRTSDSWSDAASRGWVETRRSLTMVYRFLNKLTTGQVPVSALGGPVTIAQAAGYSAFEGMGKLLIFLTMLSANLAVINFLPIPVLDGGHMVFLLWEGIRGKPAGERMVGALTTVGLVFIVTLMLFVLSLDVGLIPRNL
jgi:regulator of sigma E protease